MLTEAEKKWLEERENRICKFCVHCPGYLNTSPCLDWWGDTCVMDTTLEEFRDAAEFEAQVAAIMPYVVFKVVAAQAEQKDITIDSWECLKLARLAVEAEMEKEK